jgi:ribosome-binding ATPase YchF (GTP1/OBG family)
MEQLKVGTNDLPSAVKKKVITAAALVSSTEAFSTVGLALQLEVPTVAATNIPDQKVGEECWNSDLDGRLETMATSVHLKVVAACIHLEAEVATTSEATRLWETLPTTSQVFGLYENPVT